MNLHDITWQKFEEVNSGNEKYAFEDRLCRTLFNMYFY